MVDFCGILVGKYTSPMDPMGESTFTVLAIENERCWDVPPQILSQMDRDGWKAEDI